MISALLFLINSLIQLAIVLIIVTAILSWLVAFDVINLRNPTLYRIVRALDGLSDPLLRPIRRIMPNLGGIDISPIILLLLLQALRILVDRTLGPLAYGGTVGL